VVANEDVQSPEARHFVAADDAPGRTLVANWASVNRYLERLVAETYPKVKFAS